MFIKSNMISRTEIYDLKSIKKHLKCQNNIIHKDALDILEEDYLIRKDERVIQIVDEYLKASGKYAIEEIKDKDKLIEQLLARKYFLQGGS